MDEYYYICNTRVNDAIYILSKDNQKYLQFRKDFKNGLYYMGISKTKVNCHCYFNNVKKGKSMISIFDKKRAKAVRILQERCTFLSNEDFINALKYNAIKGINFRRRDVKIINKIYGYSKGVVDCIFEYPHIGIKMNRTTEDIKAPVPLKIMEHYKYVPLILDTLFVNNVAFLLAKSIDIEFIHCKAIFTKSDK